MMTRVTYGLPQTEEGLTFTTEKLSSFGISFMIQKIHRVLAQMPYCLLPKPKTENYG